MSIDPLQMGMPMIQATQAKESAEDLKRMELGKAARQFESYMAQTLIREMRKTVPDGIFSSSAMEVFGGVLDDEISKRISESGQLGLADQLMRGLTGDHEMNVDGLHPSLLMGDSGVGGTGFMAYGDTPKADGQKRARGILPLRGRLSSKFGWRKHPILGHRQHHEGMDIAAAKGTRIDAVRSGKVVFSGEQRGYGNIVILDHGNGLTSRYAHCDELNVQVGDRVRAGQGIATVGSTGRSTGPHLHFEVRQDGEALDPQEYFGWHKQ